MAGQQRQDPFKQLFLHAPHPRVFQRQGDGLSRLQCRVGACQGANVFGQRPVHHHGRFTFCLQAIEHAQRAGGLAGPDGFCQLAGVVTRNVQHGRFHLLKTQFAGGVQQRQLLQLLVCGQQIAFDAVGKKSQRSLPLFARRHLLLLALKALRQPGR